MNYRIVVTKNDGSDIVLEKDFNCGYLFLGESDGCSVMRISEGCEFDTMLNTALFLMKYAYKADDVIESFARMIFKDKYMEDNDDHKV